MIRDYFFLLIIAGCAGCSVKKVHHAALQDLPAKDSVATIQFSGYIWNVKSGAHYGPGPNYWSGKNVWVDDNGFLHLKITKDSASGKWLCAEVSTQQKFGLGKWQFWVEGKIDELDKNVVLGLFNYSHNSGFDEMDIEWSRWGNDHYPNCNFTVWPAKSGDSNFSYTKEISFKDKYSTHRFIRESSNVYFESLQGFTNGNASLLASATCSSPPNSISILAMPVHINLWLFKGLPPADEKEVEIVIQKFSFTPQ